MQLLYRSDYCLEMDPRDYYYPTFKFGEGVKVKDRYVI